MEHIAVLDLLNADQQIQLKLEKRLKSDKSLKWSEKQWIMAS